MMYIPGADFGFCVYVEWNNTCTNCDRPSCIVCFFFFAVNMRLLVCCESFFPSKGKQMQKAPKVE